MKFWNNIRNFFYRKRWKQALAGVKVGRSIINLQDAATVGIIYESSPANDSVIAAFADGLRKEGKKVEVVGFVNDKKIVSKPGIVVLNSNNVSWAKVPKGEGVDKFAGTRFDLLLACFTAENLPLEYIAGISRAAWRVGAYSNNKTECYDMMINLGGRKELPYLLEQMASFLNRIKAA